MNERLNQRKSESGRNLNDDMLDIQENYEVEEAGGEG